MKKKQTSSIIGYKPIVKYPNREALPMNKKSMIGISAVETAEQHRGNMPVIPKQITPFEKEIMEGAEVEANAAVTPIKKPGDYTHVKSFSEAFGAARKAGLSEFTWLNPRTGKSMQYGTKLASEVESAKMPANTSAKAAPVKSPEGSSVDYSTMLNERNRKMFSNIYGGSGKFSGEIATASRSEEDRSLIRNQNKPQGNAGQSIAGNTATQSSSTNRNPAKSIIGGGRSKFGAMHDGIGVGPKAYEAVADVIAGKKKYSDLGLSAQFYLNSIVRRSLGPKPEGDAIGHEKWVTFRDEKGTPIRQVKNPKYDVKKAVKEHNAIYNWEKRKKALIDMYGKDAVEDSLAF